MIYKTKVLEPWTGKDYAKTIFQVFSPFYIAYLRTVLQYAISKGDDYMYENFVRERITQLRLQKGVSEYKMSYDLGHSRGYVNNISSGKALPSMAEFFAICEYFDITPIEFFNQSIGNPRKLNQTITSLEQLNEDDLNLIALYINRLLK